MDFNQITLTGRLTRHPEARTTQAGKSVCEFSIAVNRTYNNEGGVDYFRVKAWEKLADICEQCLVKGSPIVLSGRMQSRKYEKDGVQREVWEVIARDVKFLGVREKVNADDTPKPEELANPANVPSEDEYDPFESE